jgi:hypothetical protein
LPRIGDSWLFAGGFGASLDFRGRSADDLLGFFSSPEPADESFLPGPVLFEVGGVGGMKLGGFSLSPEIRPSDMSFLKLENSSFSP